MGNCTEYYIPSGFGKAEYEEKRSRFIAYLEKTESEEDAKAFIAGIKKENYDARHNCWCYIIKDGPERYSDDGEPQGTAGIPMLEVFRHENITNAVCVVTRYFGGILLGTGGLARAYTKAAKGALEAAGISVVRKWIECRINCPYPLFDRLRTETEAASGYITGTDYNTSVVLDILIPEDRFPGFGKRITDISSGTVEAEAVQDIYKAVPFVSG